MSFTDFHAIRIAHELTRRLPPDSAEKFGAALVDAQVDLNPHQIDAALFAFRSPLSRGALLADEVGLGKTIEAGLVLSQRWAERKRKILVITPSNLRKQWFQELTEKFFLPCRILESKSYNEAIRNGHMRPFDKPEIIICSYQFARNKASDVHSFAWDLVVIDEAHRLRNVYKPNNVIANTLKMALEGKQKLLLTATPLQNSLLELFGLVSFIDEHTFGDLKSFRERFTTANQRQVFQILKSRLTPICHRTLRRQVLPYVKYTKRFPIVQEFTPEESEDRLYNLVSDYLRRDNLQALPARQRTLMTLVLRKLLASSTFAIACALDTIITRLKKKIRRPEEVPPLDETLGEEYESLDATAEEWEDDEPDEPLSGSDRAALEREIEDLESFSRLAKSIDHNAKGRSLIQALEIAFRKADELGSSRKAIIFTESRRTQSYLMRVLADSPYAEGVVLFNGSNNDERSKAIFADWMRRYEGTDRVTGSKSADMRSALVDYFRDEGRIMIATEAGAEGINLQFCSLVVNYDLPWNPQRIEQRIGRCHRYGQKHDVVVVNFLNRNNAADQRVFTLLSEKFMLFEGVFGSSDEVLGAIESGIDFEKRIAGIYQRCRKPEEIQAAFDELQSELGAEIDESLRRTRCELLENFDDEVREKLKIRDEASRKHLNRFERLLMRFTRHGLGNHAEFIGDSSFRLLQHPFQKKSAEIPLGLYELPRRSGDAHLYRIHHPLAQSLLDHALSLDPQPAEIRFSYAEHEGKVSILEPWLGHSGWLAFYMLSVETFDLAEDHLIHAAVTEDGEVLDEETASRLLTLPGRIDREIDAEAAPPSLDEVAALRQKEVQRIISERNARYFEDEAEKLDGWADDLKIGLEREIKELDRKIKEARKEALAGRTLEEKLAGQKIIKALEAERNTKRRTLFDAHDEIDKKRGDLIAGIESKLKPKTEYRRRFVVRWNLE